MEKNKKNNTLQGSVTYPNNEPIKGVLVRATDQAPNTPEHLLGTPIYIDDKEKYKFTYKDEYFRIGDQEIDEEVYSLRKMKTKNKLCISNS